MSNGILSTVESEEHESLQATDQPKQCTDQTNTVYWSDEHCVKSSQLCQNEYHHEE